MEVSDESAKIGRRYRSTGSMGERSPICRRTSKTPETNPAPRTAAVVVQSASCAPSPMPKISSPKVVAFSTALTESKRWVARGVAGRERNASAIATAPAGTLTANSQGHDATDRIPAAMVGPTAVKLPTTIAFTPTPLPRERAG